ncbi:MAG: Npt1/Npt2 family nucleotide transporter [Elusimicrobiota bacterium]
MTTAGALRYLGESKEERLKSLLLFTYFFLVIAVFWTMKPIRTSKFLSILGVQFLPYMKLGTAGLVLPIMMFYSVLSRRYRREYLVSGWCVFFSWIALVFWRLFSGDAAPAVHVAFFFFVDIYITVMVALFWSFANDLTPPEQARRTYGLVGAGGILGGVAGSAATGWLSGAMGPHNLLFVCALLLLVIPGIALPAARAVERPPAAAPGPVFDWSAAVAGARLTFKTPYLLQIAGIVTLYEIISNLVDYQFSAAVAVAYPQEAAMAAFLGKFFTVNIAVSVVFQLIFTTLILRRWGPKVGLLILPLVLGLGSAAFLAVPVFTFAAGLLAADSILHYSVNQTSKEVLYTPTDESVKYRAKAFIDMFLYRFAKGISSLLILATNLFLIPHGWRPEHLGVFSLLFAAAWLLLTRKASAEFDLRTGR